jgi:hypothetical protein
LGVSSSGSALAVDGGDRVHAKASAIAARKDAQTSASFDML